MRFLDLEALKATPLETEPFPYLIVPRFIRRDQLARVYEEFPRIERAGSFPTSEVEVTPYFAAFLAELESPELRHAFAEKFAMDLEGRPTLITLRGQTREKDGRIHTDTKTKLITVLIYLNPVWGRSDGRLRLLRSATDLEAKVAEIPPEDGNLLAFKVTENSWHGHTTYAGPRRAIQLNWLTSEDVARRELSRHRFSARLKRLVPFA